MKLNIKTYRRSVGQFRRHHGNLLLGSEHKRAPYFKLLDNTTALKNLFPNKRLLISQYETKLLKATTLKAQNRLYGDLIEKVNKR
jgi:hypothetical protein